MLIDTHCHIDFAAFDEDRMAVIENASQLGVEKIIVPSVDQNRWLRTIELCAGEPTLRLALGLHPVFIDAHEPHHLSELDRLVRTHNPIAIGEIGLDYYLRDVDREKQNVYFAKQLIIAKRHNLPVIIHCRKAHDQCLDFLRETSVKGGIIHAFNGSIQQAQEYIKLGFMLGFGGMLTYTRSRKLRALVEQLSIESLVLETDAPDMVVAAHRGSRNSPEYLPLIAQAVAEIKNLSVDEVATQTSANARRVLALPTNQ